MGARASSAAPLSYAIIQTTGACASDAALLSLGRGTRAPSAAPPKHTPRSIQITAPAHLSFKQGCPAPPPPGDTVSVVLRCGKDGTENPRSCVQLDSAFPGNSGGLSTLSPVKDKATRLLTSSPFPSRPDFDVVYWVCRPSFDFTHASPRALCSFG